MEQSIEKIKFRRLLFLFTAQFFLALVYFIGLDLLHRWDSLRYQVDVRRIINTVFLLGLLSFFAAGLVSIVLSSVTALVQRMSIRLTPWIMKVFQLSIFVLGSQIHFIFLRLWIRNTIPTQHFDRDARVISLAALLGIFVIFLLLHYFVLRKPIAQADPPKIIGVLLIPLVLLTAGSIVLSIVIEHHPDKTAFFQKYGLALFLVYYVLYRKKIHIVLSRFRLFVIPALIMFVIILAGTVYAFVGFEPIPEIAVDTAQDQAKKKG